MLFLLVLFKMKTCHVCNKQLNIFLALRHGDKVNLKKKIKTILTLLLDKNQESLNALK